MYKSFFGLKKNPFNVNPDPAYLYLTAQMRQSVDELTFGIESRKGLMLLTGEAGTGKTTLVNHLLLWLGHQRARTAFIFNSHLDCAQLFDFIFSDFEIPFSPQATTNRLLVFNEWLLARYRSHELVVLIVDEAQGLPGHVLEEIRLLSNMETPDEKLLQILLVGQPELETKLKRPDLRQLQQRIALRCKTAPLALQETQGYIEDRLQTAGSRNASVFAAEAVEAIHNYSRGIPRVINLLCENALIHAYVEQERKIPAAFIAEAARDLQFEGLKPTAPRVRTFPQPAEPADLHSILAKIKEDADERHDWSETRFVPHLIRQNVTSTRGHVDVRAASNILPLANLRATTRPTDRVQPKVWRKDRFADFFRTIGAELYSATTSAIQSLRALELEARINGLSTRIRLTAAPRILALSSRFGSEVKIRAFAFSRTMGARTEWLQNWWWKQDFNEENYGRSFTATAAVALLLFLVAHRATPAQSWHHPGMLVVAFAGFLLCALSLAVSVSILVRAHRQLREDASDLFMIAMRWLRAPIYPMQIRELGSVASKMESHRRA